MYMEIVTDKIYVCYILVAIYLDVNIYLLSTIIETSRQIVYSISLLTLLIEDFGNFIES